MQAAGIPYIIQTLRAFRLAVQVDVIEELKFQRPVDEDDPGRQLGGRKAPQEADFGGKRRPRTPTWSENGAKRRPKERPEAPKMKPESQHKRTKRKSKKP